MNSVNESKIINANVDIPLLGLRFDNIDDGGVR